jgi:carbonic anhydrase
MADDQLRAAADAYHDTFVPSGYGPNPQRRLVVVACMDARLDLFRMLSLEVGDVHLLRNAGGLVTDDVIRSLTLSQRALGTRQIVLVHHTDCGLQKIDDNQFLDEIERETGQRPTWTPGAFTDPFDDVRVSLGRLHDSPWLLSDDARGFVFDVATGELIEVTLES